MITNAPPWENLKFDTDCSTARLYGGEMAPEMATSSRLDTLGCWAGCRINRKLGTTGKFGTTGLSGKSV